MAKGIGSAIALSAVTLFTGVASAQTVVNQEPDREITLTVTGTLPGQEPSNSNRPHETNLTGVAWALSVAGDTYDLGGSRIYLPNDAEGWEDDLDLGFGVYGPVGNFGHMGAGVGFEDDDEVSLRATFGMKW
jgi:hypothetical protein